MDRGSRVVRAAWIVGLAALVSFAAATRADAAFPGRNGLLVVKPASGSGLILVGSGGAPLRRICGPTTRCAGASGPVWSPDGSEIAFSSYEATDSLGGPQASVIYPDASCLACPVPDIASNDVNVDALSGFLPDGRLAVSMDGQLGAVNTDGVGFQPLNVVGDWRQLAWSSAGQLAAVRSVKHKGEVFVIDPVSDVVRRLTGDGASSPNWSPGGRRLAVVHRGWIELVGVDGGPVKRLTRGRAPVWSPDGKELAFVGAHQRLFVISARGGRPRPVGHIHAQSVDWQPFTGTPASNCEAPAGARVVVASADATISVDSAAPAAGGLSVLACLASDGRERVLEGFPPGGPSAFYGVGAAAVAGDYAAVVNGAFSNRPFFSFTVVVFDLRTGAAVANRGGETVVCRECFGPAGLDQLVVGADGVTAAHTFVANGTYPASSYTTIEQIVANDSTGTHVLDTTTTTGPLNPTPSALSGLALTGDTLTWSHDGAPESAELK